MPGEDDDSALGATLPSGGHATVATLAPAGDAPPIPRGTEIGRYIVLGPIGAGAMGVVVSAIDPTLDRKVALKLVKADRGGSTVGQQRLLREAQAMARLSHPNVVTVYEAGTFGERVYLAMEFIAGTTLADWLATPRSAREIIDAFVAAGRGLAAAHRAGIVHRDFKPANVLVARDGRVRVADFGLATAPESRAISSPPLDDVHAPDLGMTATGAILGTPTYMAPEQHRGTVATAKADQFAFCVALWEALRGALPFEGTQYAVYASNVLAGTVRDAGKPLPARIKRALLRGMAVEPANRYPDVEALLAELTYDPSRRVKLAAVAAGALLVASGGAYALLRGGPDPCNTTRDDVWSAPVRETLAVAFRASGAATAETALERTTKLFEARQAQLDAGRHAACVATAVTHEQSSELLDRRMRCLDRRAADTKALLAVLTDHPTASVVAKAIESTLQLSSVQECADRDALLADVAPPAPPMRAGVAVLEDRLAAAHALLMAGKLAAARAAVDQLLPDADRTAYLPLRARAHVEDAAVELALEHNEQALIILRETSVLAAAAHDDRLVARSAIQTFSGLGYKLARLADAKLVEPFAAAAVTRAGSPADLLGNLDLARGAVALRADDFGQAAELFHRGAGELATALGPDDYLVGNALANEGAALSAGGHYEEARKVVERALAIRVKAFGETNPRVGSSHYQLGVLFDSLQQPKPALDEFQRALAIREKSLPANHPEIAEVLVSIGIVLVELRRPDEAIVDQSRAIAIFEQSPANNRASLGVALMDLANSYRAVKRYDDAIATYQRALDLETALYGANHTELADTYDNLGETYHLSGQPKRAIELWQRSLAIREKRLGPDHPDVAKSLDNLAEQSVVDGHYADAVAGLDRAIAIYTKAGMLETELGRDMVAMRDKARKHLQGHRAR